MPTNETLQIHDEQRPAPLQTLEAGPEPLLRLIQKVVDGGVTESNVAALDKLLAVYERLDDKRAEREFSSAFVALQNDLPVIVAETVIPNRGKYSRFEDVMHIVGPLLVKHGFSVSFSMDFKDNRIVETCHLKHIGGHSQSNSFAVRAGGKADSDTQADCKAATTAKRNALLNCLNIVVRQDVMQNEDGDASLEGSLISRDQLQYLNELLAETKSDQAKFLAMAGVDKMEDIRSGSYQVLVRALLMKKR